MNFPACKGCGECCLGLPCLDAFLNYGAAGLRNGCPDLVEAQPGFYRCRKMQGEGKAAWVMKQKHASGVGCGFKSE